MSNDRPWLRFNGKVPHSITYPKITLYERSPRTLDMCRMPPRGIFFDTTCSYRNLLTEIDRFASALAALGLQRGERLLISMPTSPQGIIAFYAANKLVAVPAMIHPLSTGPEIKQFLNAVAHEWRSHQMPSIRTLQPLRQDAPSTI